MIVTITAPVTHRCPFRDERDYGEVEITYDTATALDAVEWHALRSFLDSFSGVPVTNEGFHQAIEDEYPFADVVSSWRVANMAVVLR